MRIGLVAGSGALPLIFANEAKLRGDTVVAFGLKGVTAEELAGCVDKIHWLEWGNFQKGLLLLVTERIRNIVLLGKIKKDIFFKGDESLDEKSRKLLDGIKDRKDYSILKEVSKVMGALGIEVMDPTVYLKGLFPSKGVLTKRSPTEDERNDIRYGSDTAMELARLDIGQTVAVRNKTVIAVEAVEGTDEAIKRAGLFCNVPFTVVKVARPDQDMRFDIPSVGIDTLKALIEAKGSVLALEEGKTLLIGREEMVALADEKGVSIVII